MIIISLHAVVVIYFYNFHLHLRLAWFLEASFFFLTITLSGTLECVNIKLKKKIPSFLSYGSFSSDCPAFLKENAVNFMVHSIEVYEKQDNVPKGTGPTK